MKWFQIANLILPVITFVYPAAAPLIPYIQNGIFQAQQIHGDTNNDAKKALVQDAVGAAVATGKVKIDTATAASITDAVFLIVDGVKAVVKANQPAA